jgi:hypothetical protein
MPPISMFSVFILQSPELAKLFKSHGIIGVRLQL